MAGDEFTTDFLRFIGVAPEATLLSFKVFSDVRKKKLYLNTRTNTRLTLSQIDSTDEDTLIEAFLMAYDAGVSFTLFDSDMKQTSLYPSGRYHHLQYRRY